MKKLKSVLALLVMFTLIATAGCAASRDFFAPYQANSSAAGTSSFGGG